MNCSNPDSPSHIRDEIVELEQHLKKLAAAIVSLSAVETNATSCFSIEEGQVRRIIAARRIRDQLLGDDLAASPAWDLLLEVLASELGESHITVSDLCGATNVPASTTIRWLKKLELDGWVRLYPSTEQRQCVQMTPSGSTKLRGLFNALGYSLSLA